MLHGHCPCFLLLIRKKSFEKKISMQSPNKAMFKDLGLEISQAKNSAQCYMAAWMGGEFEEECLPGGSVGREYTCNARGVGSIPGLGRSPGGGNGDHSTILAWEIPWTEEPGGLQSIGSQRDIGVTKHARTHMYAYGCVTLQCTLNSHHAVNRLNSNIR